jgi:hypothetical protein
MHFAYDTVLDVCERVNETEANLDDIPVFDQCQQLALFPLDSKRCINGKHTPVLAQLLTVYVCEVRSISVVLTSWAILWTHSCSVFLPVRSP